MAQRTSFTLSGWLRHATARLAAAGIDTARSEAERIAAHGLGVGWSAIWARLDEGIDDAALDELLERRCAGEPLGYVLGTAVFCGLELACGPGVLVPRPETEAVVDVVADALSRENPVVVDVGTGTGAIALAVADRRADAEVWGIDVSSDALQYAKENVRRTGLSVRLATGDLLAALPAELRRRVDVVVSNPPYVPSGREDLVAPDVLAEPRDAVFAGPTGDEVLERLVAEAPAWLRGGGTLVLEIGTPEQAERTTELLAAFRDVETTPDHAGRPRVVSARLL